MEWSADEVREIERMVEAGVGDSVGAWTEWTSVAGDRYEV